MPDHDSLDTKSRPGCGLRQLCLYFLRLGTVGFGGPIALVGYMQRDLVEDRKWLTEEEFREGLALSQLAPGPLAAQLAIYIGWVRGRVFGATAVGLAFVIPSFLMVVILAFLYLRFDGLPWMRGAFYAIAASVMAVIARSALKLVRITPGKDNLLRVLCVINAAVTVWTESELFWVFALSGLVAMLVKAPPRMRGGAALFSPFLPLGVLGSAGGEAPNTSLLWEIGLFFAKAGSFVFGSGLAIIPFLYGGVVEEHRWLTDRQFLDAVAVAMITPGPVVITVSFIGYLVAGPLGATVAAVGVFLPCYLLVVLPAPYFRHISGNRQVKAFVDGVTAAATGAIVGAAVVLGKRAITDLPTVLFAAATLVLLMQRRKIPEPLIILAAGVVGALFFGRAT